MLLPAEGSKIYRYLILIAIFFIVVIGLKMTAYIFTIVIISLILTLLGIPVMDRLRRKGLPDILSVTILTVLAIFLILLLVGLTVYSFGVLSSDLPLYQTELNARLAEITGFLNSYGIDAGAVAPPSVNLESIIGIVLSSVMSLGDLALYLFFIAVTTFFMLLEAPHLADRAKKLFGTGSEKIARLSRMSHYMIDFVVVRTETNLVHGVLFGGTLYVMGVHAALLWGILTFVLSYIPYIGLIIAAIPAIFFAWLQFGLWGALSVVALVCVLNLVVENPVFSYFASRTFEIPALLVIISVIFWGWLFGIAGMVFAVPITLMILILIQCSDELSWVNVLLGVDRLFENSDREEPGK